MILFFRDIRTSFFLFLLIFLLGSSSTLAELSQDGLKCLSCPAYYPGAGIGFSKRIADEIAYLNSDMIRVEFIGEYDAERSINYCAYDYINDKATSRGISILGLIDYQSVSWEDKSDWATDEFRTRYVERVGEIVSHYHQKTNSIRNWEIWNEEDIGIPEFNVRIEPEPYAKILIEAYHKIKSIDAGSTVVLGGLSPKGFFYSENYLEDLYATDAIQEHYTQYGYHPFDVVACHPYPEIFSNPDPGMANVLNQRIKSVMNANNDRFKKVWLTEMGWNRYYVSENKQAQYLKQSYELMDTLTDPAFPDDPPYVERYFWFHYRDFGSIDFWGLVGSDYTDKKQAYYEYLDLTERGPEPPGDLVEPGENPPYKGESQDLLPETVSSIDLIEGMQGIIVSGGFHSASEGGVEKLTNGLFDNNGLSVVLADYLAPALRVRYEFTESVDITELRIFGGHFGLEGNRGFQSNDIYVNGELAKKELNTGFYEQTLPRESVVSLVQWLPPEGETFCAENVKSIEIAMYCVAHIGSGFADRWGPCIDPEKDKDGLGAAYVSPIIKEIDVFGEIHKAEILCWFLY
jgi:putative glycosyl hydrolase